MKLFGKIFPFYLVAWSSFACAFADYDTARLADRQTDQHRPEEARRMHDPDGAKDMVEIVNSGSTNTTGYQILVEKSGLAHYSVWPRKQLRPHAQQPLTEGKISAKLADQLFADVQNAMPLSKHAAPQCMKSTSFGFTMTVSYGQEQSPDLTCPRIDAQLEALHKDAQEVVEALKIANRPVTGSSSVSPTD